MSELAEIQAVFSSALLNPSEPIPSAIGRRPGSAQSRRFNVYRNNIISSLVEALETSFPAISRLVGEKFFKAAAADYIRKEPPSSPVLLFYGSSFGDFLDSYEPAATVPYLGDVARLEWARINAYNAPDAMAITVKCLFSVDDETIGNYILDGGTMNPYIELREIWR